MIDHILKASLEQGTVITIIYEKDKIITKRNIKVLEIGDTCIKAYCYWRRQIRVFSLVNILAAEFCRSNVKLQ